MANMIKPHYDRRIVYIAEELTIVSGPSLGATSMTRASVK
jgi:hypothetical protein